MFKFNFLEENEDKSEENEKFQHSWLESQEIFPKDITLIKDLLSNDGINKYSYNKENININYISSIKVLNMLQSSKNVDGNSILAANTNHSDLVTSVYEGGLKIWECTHDLINYLLNNTDIDLKNKRVLDLGCGAGFIGIIALLKQSAVYFQDYNVEVIKYVTIPNVLLNCNEDEVDLKCKFFSGDWRSFLTVIKSDEKFDYIFTSETIYNIENYKKLHDVFKEKLKCDGVIYLAAKCYYFGVGGGIQQFENLVRKENVFNIKKVWECEEGFKREIIKLTFL